jgi:transposase
MRVGIALRGDFSGSDLRRLAKASDDAGQARRLLALAEISDGNARTNVARMAAVGLQTVRDWVLRFNARGPEGLINGKAPGNPAKLNEAQRRALVVIVEAGPIPAVHGVVRWRIVDLIAWVYDEFGISMSEATMSRELRSLNLRKLSARPRHHAQNEFALEAFKKTSRRRWRKSRRSLAKAPRSKSGFKTKRA